MSLLSYQNGSDCASVCDITHSPTLITSRDLVLPQGWHAPLPACLLSLAYPAAVYAALCAPLSDAASPCGLVLFVASETRVGNSREAPPSWLNDLQTCERGDSSKQKESRARGPVWLRSESRSSAEQCERRQFHYSPGRGPAGRNRSNHFASRAGSDDAEALGVFLDDAIAVESDLFRGEFRKRSPGAAPRRPAHAHGSAPRG